MRLGYWLKPVCIIVLCLCFAQGIAQNLVPNASFEDYNSCPTGSNDLGYSPVYTSFPTVRDWINPLYTSTPDYFHACAPSPALSLLSTSTPGNFIGHQLPRTGQAYAGIVPYTGASLGFAYSEYLECKLTQPLKAGHKYDVEFYVSFTYKTIVNPYRNVVAVNRMGVHFSDTFLYHPGYLTGNQVLSIPYHIQYTGNYLADTTNWVKISGVYTAHGGEEYLVIGTFNDGNPVNVMNVFPSPPNVSPLTDNSAYYYIDDVSVKDQVPCDTAIKRHDSTICPAESFSMMLNGNTNGTSYQWNTGATSATITINNTGTYWCRAYKDCNLYIDTFFIKPLFIENRVQYDTTVCDAAMLALSSRKNAPKYTWNTGATTKSIVIDSAGVYWCKTTDSCRETTETFLVRQKEFDLELDLGPDMTFCKENIPTIGRLVNDVQYKWNTGAETCCIRPTEPGRYVLTIYNECYSTADEIEIELIKCQNCLFIPSAFTPNADGTNDLFSVLSSCPISDYQINIYNRWGENVFRSADLNKKWDGTYKGVIVPTDVYYYYVQFRAGINNLQQMIKGDVTVIR